jgi:L-ascorbate metabolism protein UlaG (beta-lactamase superfamily)
MGPTMAAPLVITWVGHATVLIEIDGLRLLTDPVLRRRIGPLMRTVPGPDPAVGRAIDCVLLSHLHADHADLPTLRSLEGAPVVLAPGGAEGWLAAQGLPDARGLAAGSEAWVGPLAVAATRAAHPPDRRPLGGPAAAPIGFLVRGGSSVYFAGDTDLFGEMEDLRGRVDVALLPIWGWGSKLGPGHLDPERAAAATALIAPAVVIPVHWGTFALGPRRPSQADRERPAHAFAALAARAAPGVDVRVLAPGGITRIG